MNSNIVIANYKNCILCMKFSSGILDEIGLYPLEGEHIKSVYIGKVKNIVKNINAAFIDIAPGLTCYLNLNECKHLHVTNRIRSENDLRQGDELLVQLIKAPVKSKNPVCSGYINLPKEIRDDIFKKAATRTCYSVLYSGKAAYLEFFNRFNLNDIEKITCEGSDIYDEVRGFLANDYTDKIALYNDDYPLNKLYKFDSLLGELTGKTVWLKSGANIVIEYTEAMTVIDVNTAKSIRDKANNHILDTNLEAASEIFRQIRLRNLSGMILIDFINDSEDNTKLLIDRIIELSALDHNKCEYIDITGLGIVELTRKKKSRPIYELINLLG